MKRFITMAAIAFAVTFGSLAQDAPKHEGETALSKRWCDRHGGIAEWRLADNSRVDCLLEDFAVEHDFSHGLKPLECLAQALYYAAETGREPLCVIIWRHEEQTPTEFIKAARRAIVAAARARVKVWCVDEALAEVDCATGRLY